jgi:hypothetical protein
MPNNWINRSFEELLSRPHPGLALFPIWLVLGPRQVGKSSVLLRLAESQRQIITLDDLALRTRAHSDPLLFSRELKVPLLIDEIQYAPELLSALKQMADTMKTPGMIWLSGSQNFEVMKGVRESLAGRVAILNLLGLSDEEKGTALTPQAMFQSIIATGFPKLQSNSDVDGRALYLSSYLQTYVERDVRELMGIQKRREFEVFLKLCALRTAQVVNYEDLGRDAGISSVTAKEWLSVLEDSFLIRLVHPYFSNRSKRLIKSPKLYFLDAGLAAHLAGWQEPESARLGPMAGALFETHVFCEILKYHQNRAQPVDISFWRTRDGEEIDFLVEARGRVTPVEVKLGTAAPSRLPSLNKLRSDHWDPGMVMSLAHGPRAPAPLNEEWMSCCARYDLNRSHAYSGGNFFSKL